jgi:hypothetical protein
MNSGASRLFRAANWGRFGITGITIFLNLTQEFQRRLFRADGRLPFFD